MPPKRATYLPQREPASWLWVPLLAAAAGQPGDPASARRTLGADRFDLLVDMIRVFALVELATVVFDRVGYVSAPDQERVMGALFVNTVALPHACFVDALAVLERASAEGRPVASRAVSGSAAGRGSVRAVGRTIDTPRGFLPPLSVVLPADHGNQNVTVGMLRGALTTMYHVIDAGFCQLAERLPQ